MNTHPSRLYILVPRHLAGRVVTAVNNAFDAASAVLALWCERRARIREVCPLDAVIDMNEHMLKDMGIHDRLTSHAARQKIAEHRRRISVHLLASLLAVALMATTAHDPAGAATDSPPTAKTRSQAPTVGVFTGEYVDGTPVYRLPPVSVVASRKVTRGKLERAEQSTRAQQARAKAAAKTPV